MKSLLLLFGLLPLICFSQKIKVNEIDKFTKSHKIETSAVFVKQGLSCGLGFQYRSVDSTIFLMSSGYGCTAMVIGSKDELTFLFENDKTLSVKSTGIQDYNITSSQYGTQKTYTHQYSITKDQVIQLSKESIKGVRIYGNSNSYVDVEVSGGNKKDVISLSEVFLKEFDKH